MDVSGVVLRQIPCVSGSVADGRYSGLRLVSEFSGNNTLTVRFRTRKSRGISCNKNDFSDKSHTNYYFEPARCVGDDKEKTKVMEKEKKALKKKAKVLKSLSKNLNMFSSIGFGLDPEAGLVGEIQTKTISVRNLKHVLKHRVDFFFIYRIDVLTKGWILIGFMNYVGSNRDIG